MEPRYSVLLCNQILETYKENIEKWLHTGIKVIWFGGKEDVVSLKESYPDFSGALLLLAYEIEIPDECVIMDGQIDDRDIFERIAEECPLFNSAQYAVEHCGRDEHIVVQASAGTGKTTVMIDRIMYLLHTEPDLALSEVFMITFTNAAADQMNQRLQDVLMKRYSLTRQTRYLRWLEEQSQMNISTIHSFALYMLKEYGIGEGFTKNVSIRSFRYDRNELIKDVIDEKTDDSTSVINQLGVPFYKASDIIFGFWNEVHHEGFTQYT